MRGARVAKNVSPLNSQVADIGCQVDKSQHCIKWAEILAPLAPLVASLYSDKETAREGRVSEMSAHSIQCCDWLTWPIFTPEPRANKAENIKLVC